MARPSRVFICQNCGARSARWAGRCNECGAWNSITEETAAADAGRATGLSGKPGRPVALASLDGPMDEAPRIAVGLGELDRVLGGGIVPGSAILIGGDPGIGKSTLLLQAAARLASAGESVIYFSGEEAPAQVRLRAERLGLRKAPVGLASETHLGDIIATISAGARPSLIIIDSIQTIWTDVLEAGPGTVGQVRTCSEALVRLAKKTGMAVMLVGHVTKEGQIAGPKVVEHMVDTVLYFEGDSGRNYRILRAVKNRFGPADEIGVFEMRGDGLKEVSNPSELFLGDRETSSPGMAVLAGIEGTRPVLVEIQALVAPSPLATPRRTVVGWDSGRLAMILAVLEARCGLKFGGQDVYLNVAGGLRVREPAADLAVAAALISSLAGVALPPECVYAGEISLSGALRPVGQLPTRLKEAEKLGFRIAVVSSASDLEMAGSRLTLQQPQHLADVVAWATSQANEDIPD